MVLDKDTRIWTFGITDADIPDFWVSTSFGGSEFSLRWAHKILQQFVHEFDLFSAVVVEVSPLVVRLLWCFTSCGDVPLMFHLFWWGSFDVSPLVVRILWGSIDVSPLVVRFFWGSFDVSPLVVNFLWCFTSCGEIPLRFLTAQTLCLHILGMSGENRGWRGHNPDRRYEDRWSTGKPEVQSDINAKIS